MTTPKPSIPVKLAPNTPLTAAWSDLLDTLTRWGDVGGSLLVGGWVLFLSGLFHTAVWGVLGGPWEGPLAWRKPILFGLSTGVTLWSLAWVLGKLRPVRGDRWVAWVTSLALVVEVALITLQTWRGVASHFNRATFFDASLGELAQWLVWLASIAILYVTFRALFYLPLEPAMRLATQAGLLLLVVGCGLGVWTAMRGEQQLEAQLTPEILPPHGVIKFPHGMAMHAIQLLPLLAWLAHYRQLSSRRAMRVVLLATAASCTALLYSLLQTLAGRPRIDGSLPLFLVLLASLFLFFLATIELIRSESSPDQHAAGDHELPPKEHAAL
ncbi:hypothetical protein Psta_1311 [Pirellula staleyi DSM 6068]|uniref:Uncharacterized protein n=1 Tax=Pirellula staleyi (strain ATCC 27377 / DSM 6068 / ICPB 4128) TaxID=530564 RepID=D2QWB3_PIRSD|nr:hypothetical protein [Pirellula staleyi]ADB15988.1 hypothetical protein Psta_1311 [Pirellula staleyi DSM 6068]